MILIYKYINIYFKSDIYFVIKRMQENEVVVAKQLDSNEVTLLKALLDLEEVAKQEELIDDFGFFQAENADLEKLSELNYYFMNKARKTLIQEGIIETSYKNIPRKLFYRIKEGAIERVVLQK